MEKTRHLRLVPARATARRLVAAAIVTCAFAVPTRAELPKPSARWIELESENFRFFSNAGERATRRIAADLEELRVVLGQLTDYDLHSPVPTLIYVFRNDRDFTTFKPLYRGKPTAANGYFMRRAHANYIAINADARDASEIVFHEYVHYVAAHNMWYLPVWFEEGLAEFYETFDVVGDQARIGLVKRTRLESLDRSTPIPIAELVAVDHGSPMYNERSQKGDFYAESWALVHYLLLGNPQRRVQLQEYLALIRSGRPEPEAFVTAFNADYETIERELRSYLKSPRFKVLTAHTTVDIDAIYEISPLPYAEVLYLLGDLLAAQDPPRSEASVYIDAALAADPDHPRAWLFRAAEAEHRGDLEAAHDAYVKAAHSAPGDPLTQFRWGDFARRTGDLGNAIGALRASTEIEPSFGPAWVALAATYADLGDRSEAALTAAETAHALLPTDIDATRGLLELYLRDDRREDAATLVRASLAELPEHAGQAWMMIVQNDIRRALELLRDHQPDAAAARLALAKHDVVRASHADLLQLRIDNVYESIGEYDGVTAYEEALKLFDRGKAKEAAEILRSVIADLPEGRIASSCRQLLDHIEHPPREEASTSIDLFPSNEDIEHLNELIAARDYSGAVEFLESLHEHADGPVRAWIEARIQEIERNLWYNRFITTYNRAVDLYNEERYPEAIRILETLLRSLPEGPHARTARSLLEDSRAALQKH